MGSKAAMLHWNLPCHAISRYAYDEEALRPYFSLPKVLEGMQLGEHRVLFRFYDSTQKSVLHQCMNPAACPRVSACSSHHRQRFGIASKLFAVDIVQDNDAAERIMPAQRGWYSERKHLAHESSPTVTIRMAS